MLCFMQSFTLVSSTQPQQKQIVKILPVRFRWGDRHSFFCLPISNFIANVLWFFGFLKFMFVSCNHVRVSVCSLHFWIHHLFIDLVDLIFFHFSSFFCIKKSSPQTHHLPKLLYTIQSLYEQPKTKTKKILWFFRVNRV